MTRETEIALKNYDWLVRNRETVLSFETGVVVIGDGGADIEDLTRAGFTPATIGGVKNDQEH